MTGKDYCRKHNGLYSQQCWFCAEEQEHISSPSEPMTGEDLAPIIWKADDDWEELQAKNQIDDLADWAEWIGNYVLTFLSHRVPVSPRASSPSEPTSEELSRTPLEQAFKAGYEAGIASQQAKIDRSLEWLDAIKIWRERAEKAKALQTRSQETAE